MTESDVLPCRECGKPSALSYTTSDAWALAVSGDGFVRRDEDIEENWEPEVVSWCEGCAPPECNECRMPITPDELDEGWLDVEPDRVDETLFWYGVTADAIVWPDTPGASGILHLYKHTDCGC